MLETPNKISVENCFIKDVEISLAAFRGAFRDSCEGGLPLPPFAVTEKIITICRYKRPLGKPSKKRIFYGQADQ